MSEEITSHPSDEIDEGIDLEGSNPDEAIDLRNDPGEEKDSHESGDSLSLTSLDEDSAISNFYQLDVLVGDDDEFITCLADVKGDDTQSFISLDLATRLGLNLVPAAPRLPQISVPIYGSISFNSFVRVKVQVPSMAVNAVNLSIGVIDVEKGRVEHLVLGSKTFKRVFGGILSDLRRHREINATKMVAGAYELASEWVNEINGSPLSQCSLHPTESDHSKFLYLTSSADELILAIESGVLHEPNIEKERLPALLSELDHCAPTKWKLDDAVTISWCDRSKLALECLSGRHWDWWPLPSPHRPLKSDGIRLIWTCGCGDFRSENLPTILAQKLLRLLNERGMSGGAPGTLEPPNGRDQPQGIIHPTEPRTGPKALARDIATPGHISQMTMHNENNSGCQLPETFIFLMVASSSLDLNQIDSTEKCTRTFAVDLQDGYRQLRGFWRYWFSVYVFSHCDFFRFEKFGTSLFTDVKEDLPPEGEVPEYFYYPRPAEGPRPISPKEFQHIYYHCRKDPGIADKNPNNPFHSTVNQVRSRLRLLKAWMPALNRRYQGPLPTDTVPRIPKRCCRFDELSNVREQFWGLHAREAVSFMRVTIYIFVSMASCFVSCLWYLVGSGGEVIDLQNATVPLMVALTLINLSLIWISKH
ncbi:hypothetical protein CFIO01_06344 [Colletotrichum fioriniae PJ7]|uniref:Uncharacterized protein n=1 Tax=Colletotrichum fioriniae PJ7 TaxID=1445577 RepID=A0A010S7I7_9PEZI|nr:hypothetical protein CFIO01_06344 [Colletotrichum fioriniae PJ7]